MKNVTDKLECLFGGFEALYQSDTGVRVGDHVLALEPPDGACESFWLREDEDDGALELGLAFDRATWEHLDRHSLHDALADQALGATLPVLEGLSHLLYAAEAARRERPISGLELETQAEVDKLAICTLHRWPPHPADYRALVERLYYRFELTAFGRRHRDRYETATRVAARFAGELQHYVEARRLTDLRAALRRFWSATMADKRALARAA